VARVAGTRRGAARSGPIKPAPESRSGCGDEREHWRGAVSDVKLGAVQATAALETFTQVADANRMRGLPSPSFGVLAKVLAASCLLLVALGGIVWAAVDTAQGTTGEGDAIARVFAERASTDRALLLASENSALVAERLSSRDRAQINKLDGELAASGAQLATAIAPALGSDDVATPAEASSVARIRGAFPVYLRVRERVLQQIGRPGSPPPATLDGQLDRGVEPLLSALSAYANAHFKEGRNALATLRRDGKGRTDLLALLLGFALVSLIATVWVARGIVVRLREYADFSAHVAEATSAPGWTHADVMNSECLRPA
jgi:hypothetical protein